MFDSGSYERKMMLDSVTGGSTHEFFSNPTESSKTLENKGKKKARSSPMLQTEELREVIYKKVTKGTHNHKNPGKQDNTLKRCIKLFKKGASPEVLTELEESLKEQKEYHGYYIQRFLPALLEKIVQLNELDKEKAEEVGQIISDTISRSSNKNYFSSIIPNQSDCRNSQTSSHNVEISEFSNGNGSSSGVSSRELLATSTSSQESLSSILSSAEEDDDPQTEDKAKTELLESNPESPIDIKLLPSNETKNKMQLGQTAEEEPGVKESETPGSHTNPLQSEEKKNKRNAIATVQKLSMNEKGGENIPPKEQPNNRNLYNAFIAGCTALAVGCFIAGVIALGKVGAILFGISAVFATAAVATRYFTTPSSELTSTSSSPLVDSKQL